MKYIFRFCLVSFLSTLLLCGCVSDEVGGSGDNISQGELVPCTFKYSVADMAAGTADSRALTRIDIDQDGILSDIKNVLVVQFDGAEESSTVAYVDYITNLLDPEIMLYETDTKTILLFIANTFDGYCITKGQTLAEVKNLGLSLSGNMATTTNGIIYDESLVQVSGDEKYFMFSDCKVYDYGIQSGEDIDIKLQRNVAKITLNVTNGWDQQTLTAINVNSIPSTHLYYANRINETDQEYPLVPATVGSTTSYKNTVNSIGSSDDPVSTSLSFYVPVNMRGYDQDSEETTKPRSDCASGATYARIAYNYDYIDSEDKEVTENVYYSLYLGSDLSCDFNLCPNTFYEYNISFYGKGDDVTDDARISIVVPIDGVDYTDKKSSNCYILNPSDDNEIVYHIPIATRINEYWVDYEGKTIAPIGDDDLTSWDFEILWYDNDSNPYTALDEGDTLGANKLNIEKESVNGIASLKITLAEGFGNMGNILVAVKQNGSVLWSWHLWITDYNPYDHGFTSTATNTSFNLEGEGALHRYSGDVWETGIYKDKYIMDRNVGARSAKPTDANGFLFYQFGRKDPFPYDGNAKTSTGTDFDYTVVKSTSTMQSTVENPTRINSTGGAWCADTDYASGSILWSDKKLTDLTTGEKSIFDPSPYGFRLPIYSDLWDDYKTTINTSGVSGSDGYGYYSSSYTDLFHPACGYLVADTGKMGYLWSYAILICATPNDDVAKQYGRTMLLKGSTTDLNSQYNLLRSSAASVRCIEDVPEEE